jgi:hypothetical protein
MWPRLARAGLPTSLLVIALLAAGCGSTSTATPGATASPTANPVPTPSSSGGVPSPGATGAVAVDGTLLETLPASVDGLTTMESPEAEAAALGDPQLAKVGTAMVAGIAADASTGDFVYAVVVRLKPGALNDDVFRDWRDTYDEGACSQAGGVSRNAQAEIAGRTVYIGTCAGGLRTYHVWLEAQQLLVSASAAGDRRFGEILMKTLRVP